MTDELCQRCGRVPPEDGKKKCKDCLAKNRRAYRSWQERRYEIEGMRERGEYVRGGPQSGDSRGGRKARSGLDDLDRSIIAAADSIRKSGHVASLTGIAALVGRHSQTIRRRVVRLQSRGIWEGAYPTGKPRRNLPQLTDRAWDWVARQIPVAQRAANRVWARTGGRGDRDEIESMTIWELVCFAGVHQGTDLYELKEDDAEFIIITISTNSCINIMRRSRRSVQIDEGWEPFVEDGLARAKLAQIDLDESYARMCAMLTEREVSLLESAIQSGKSMFEAGLAAGLGHRESRDIAEWVGIKIRGFAGKAQR